MGGLARGRYRPCALCGIFGGFRFPFKDRQGKHDWLLTISRLSVTLLLSPELPGHHALERGKQMIKNPTTKTADLLTYWKGDLAIYTGKSQELHGATFYELRLLEGHRKGRNVVTQNAPKGGR